MHRLEILQGCAWPATTLPSSCKRLAPSGSSARQGGVPPERQRGQTADGGPAMGKGAYIRVSAPVPPEDEYKPAQLRLFN